MDIIAKNLHFLILFYAGFSAFEYYNEKEVKLSESISYVESQNSKLQKIEREFRDVKKYQENLKASEQKFQDVVKQLETAQRQLPSSINDAEVKEFLRDTALNLKMRTPKTVEAGEEHEKLYFIRDYNFDAEGTYLQFLILFETLENEAKKGRIVNIKYVKMEKSENGDPRSQFQLLKLSTTMETYRYNEAYDATTDKGDTEENKWSTLSFYWSYHFYY